MKTRLGSITNICVVIFAVIVGGLCARNSVFSADPSALGPPQASQFKRGEQLPALAGYDWHAHGRTLVLALRNGCHYCEDSAPFYRKIAEMEQAGQIKYFHLVAIFPDSPDIVKQTLQSEGLSLQAIPSTPLRIFKVEGTPTAILADQNGHVIDSWVGELNSKQQDAVLDEVRGSPKH
jgi:hypothetical protein